MPADAKHQRTAAPRRRRLAYLVTHPIQYQAPLLRRIAADPEIDLTVFFASLAGAETYHDPEFGKAIRWAGDLLGGYAYEKLPCWGDDDPITVLRPFSHGLARRLREGHFDALWVHGYARPFHLHALSWAKRHGLTTLLRDEVHATSRQRPPLRETIKRCLFSWIDRQTDVFLATGAPNRDYYLSLGIAASKIEIMPYAIDNAAFAAVAEDLGAVATLRRELRLQDDRPVLLFAGKLIARKGAADLLAAAKTLAGKLGREAFYLLYVGDGPERARLEADAARDLGEVVRFPGFVNQDRLPLYYALADLFVFPSHWEAWGLAVNEAMAVGTPVLASQETGAARDLIGPGKNAWLFPAGDTSALAVQLERLITNPEALRAAGAQARVRMARWDFDRDLQALRRALGLNEGT